MELSKAQQQAVSSACDALSSGREYVLAGFAGSGKTTILKTLLNELSDMGYDPAVVAPTNKAASVLRSKGVGNPTTIHALAYNYGGTKAEYKCNQCGFTFRALRGIGFCRSCKSADITSTKDRRDDDLHFIEKVDLNLPILLVDEASMVNSEQVGHLRSQVQSILWCGDPAQLPPVKSQDPRLFDRANYMLEEVFRSDRPGILDLSIALRKGAGLGYRAEERDGSVAPGLHYSSNGNLEYMVREAQADVYLVHSNKVRCRVNRLARSVAGYFGPQPQPGEKLVALANDYRMGLYNGEVVEVLDCEPGTSECYKVTVKHPLTGKPLHYDAPKDQFFEPRRPDREAIDDLFKNHERPLPFDFGYCLTAHKSQGSEWNKVAVLAPYYDFQDKVKWEYTAATRAKSELFIFGV